MADDVLVSVIDDDESVRESVPGLLRAFGFVARAFDSAEAFLDSGAADATRCVILDVAMPGMSGPDLFAQLQQRPISIPTIFITGQADRGLCRELVARGAAACLYKPFAPMALIEALKRALP